MIRRVVLHASQFAWLLLVVCSTELATADPPNPAASLHQPIIAENRQLGSMDWQLTRIRADADGYRSTPIEGYCSKQSVKAGEAIDIVVSTNPLCRFELEIFRMGYYGGRGARLMKRPGPFDGKAQPHPPIGEKNIHDLLRTPRLSSP